MFYEMSLQKMKTPVSSDESFRKGDIIEIRTETETYHGIYVEFDRIVHAECDLENKVYRFLLNLLPHIFNRSTVKIRRIEELIQQGSLRKNNSRDSFWNNPSSPDEISERALQEIGYRTHRNSLQFALYCRYGSEKKLVLWAIIASVTISLLCQPVVQSTVQQFIVKYQHVLFAYIFLSMLVCLILSMCCGPNEVLTEKRNIHNKESLQRVKKFGEEIISSVIKLTNDVFNLSEKMNQESNEITTKLSHEVVTLYDHFENFISVILEVRDSGMDSKKLLTESLDQVTLQTERPKHDLLRTETHEQVTVQTESPDHDTLQTESPDHDTLQTESPEHETLQMEYHEQVTFPTESVDHDTLPTGSPEHDTLQTESQKIVTLQTESHEQVTLQTENAEQVTLQTESHELVTLLTESVEHGSLQTESHEQVPLQTESPEHDTLQTESLDKVTLQTESLEHDYLQTESHEPETLQKESHGKVTLQTEIPELDTSKKESLDIKISYLYQDTKEKEICFKDTFNRNDNRKTMKETEVDNVTTSIAVTTTGIVAVGLIYAFSKWGKKEEIKGHSSWALLDKHEKTANQVTTLVPFFLSQIVSKTNQYINECLVLTK